jgi:predicted TIM-barrel fold metal-dependent hydrolase
MDKDRIVIVSADGHAGASRMSDYAEYVDPAHRGAYRDYLARIERYEAHQLKGLTSGGAGVEEGEEGLWDFDLRERCMDEDGVAAEILFIQGSAPFGAYPAVASNERTMEYDATPEQLAAGCRAYNRWLAERCARDPRRHLGVARIPIPDIAASVAEVEFAAKAGLKGGVALPVLSRADIPFYNDARYEPLWAACEANGMALNVHGGANISYGPGPERLALVLAETDWFSRRGLAHLIFSGVFERHPQLHIAMTEQRAHWVDFVLREWDSIYKWPGNVALRKALPRTPTEYFARNCFVGASFFSRTECDERGPLASQCYMWGGDYPHMEGTWPHTSRALRWTFGGDVSSAELRAMLGGNAARCYGLDLADLEAVAGRIGPTEADIRAADGGRPPADFLAEHGASWAFRSEGPWN